MVSNDAKKPSDNHKRCISIRTLLVEVLSIVIGVLLALTVDQWNENCNHNLEASEALINIKKEFGTNYELLEFLHKNNSLVLSNNSSTDSLKTEGNGFIPGLQLQNTVWRTLLNTGIANYVDYDRLYKISEVYSIQDIYKSFGMQLIEADMNISVMRAALGQGDGSNQSTDALASRFGFLLQVEEQLLISYKVLIEDMGG